MNDFEMACKVHLEKSGYIVLRNGWPDFLVVSKDLTRGYALELKRGKDKLSEEQVKMHATLARFGILTHVLRDEAGLRALKKGRIVFSDGDLASIDSRLNEAIRDVNNAAFAVNQIREQMRCAAALFEKPIEELLKTKQAGESIDAINLHRVIASQMGQEKAVNALAMADTFYQERELQAVADRLVSKPDANREVNPYPNHPQETTATMQPSWAPGTPPSSTPPETPATVQPQHPTLNPT
jgi:hypothetical protein